MSIKGLDNYLISPPEDDYISSKSEDWLDFADKVYAHIENYVVPQYGDKGEDPYSNNTTIEFLKQIEKYVKRNLNGNKREGQLQLDLIKIAHCAQMAYDKSED